MLRIIGSSPFPFMCLTSLPLPTHTEEAVVALMKSVPSTEEIEQVQSFDGDKEALGEAIGC